VAVYTDQIADFLFPLTNAIVADASIFDFDHCPTPAHERRCFFVRLLIGSWRCIPAVYRPSFGFLRHCLSIRSAYFRTSGAALTLCRFASPYAPHSSLVLYGDGVGTSRGVYPYLALFLVSLHSGSLLSFRTLSQFATRSSRLYKRYTLHFTSILGRRRPSLTPAPQRHLPPVRRSVLCVYVGLRLISSFPMPSVPGSVLPIRSTAHSPPSPLYGGEPHDDSQLSPSHRKCI
jgi:hypothetical protein